MVRARLASVAVAAGLGLSCGCASLSEHPWFRRGCSGPGTCSSASVPGCGCCGEGGVPVYSDGPVLEGAAPAPGCGTMLNPPLPPGAVQPLAPSPRLVPQPQAPVVPYQPTMRELR